MQSWRARGVKGEVAVAYVLAKPRATLAPGELEAFYRTRLATFIIPREFAFMDDIPKNATGTILKRVLRDQFAQDAEA